MRMLSTNLSCITPHPIDPVQLPTRTQLNSWNPAVAEATHESLMSNRNLQYIKLYDAHKNLLGRFQDAQQAYGELQIRYDTLKYVPCIHCSQVAI